MALALLVQLRELSIGNFERLSVSLACTLLLVQAVVIESARGQGPSGQQVGGQGEVRAFLTKYCQDCHQGENADAKFDITEYYDVQVLETF